MEDREDRFEDVDNGEEKTRFLDVTAALSEQLRRLSAKQSEERARIKNLILPRIHANEELRRLDLEALDNKQKLAYLRQRTEEVVRFEIKKLELDTTLCDRELLVKEILDEALGLGPLENLLADPSVTEIMVNAPDRIFVERRGKIELSESRFASVQQIYNVIERIVAPIGRRVDESTPYVDARLTRDGSRVHIIIPPLALNGPTITIRKFSERPLTAEDLIRWGSITRQAYRFLELCVRGRKNIAVSGGTGTGKTTLLNVLSNAIPDDERIITIEDAAELRLNKINLVTLETRKPNVEGKGAVTIRDLVINALRMRPDRIVVGECRGPEALDMLQAMNTGHEGSLTTIHANSPEDMLTRLENLVLMAADIPVTVIRQNIASALDLIVQISRYRDGTRKLSRITEVVGFHEGQIETRDIYVYREEGLDPEGRVLGRLLPTGHRPKFLEALRIKGFEVDDALFEVFAVEQDFREAAPESLSSAETEHLSAAPDGASFTPELIEPIKQTMTDRTRTLASRDNTQFGSAMR